MKRSSDKISLIYFDIRASFHGNYLEKFWRLDIIRSEKLVKLRTFLSVILELVFGRLSFSFCFLAFDNDFIFILNFDTSSKKWRTSPNFNKEFLTSSVARDSHNWCFSFLVNFSVLVSNSLICFTSYFSTEIAGLIREFLNFLFF